MLNIQGLDKADVLAALYNASRPQGMGFLHYTPEDMTREEAQKLLEAGRYFDYLNGRVMKLKIPTDGDEIEERLYDRDNGTGAAARVIEALRSGSVTAVTSELHKSGKLAAAAKVKTNLTKETSIDRDVVTIGLADVADVLEPAVDRAIEKSLCLRN